MAYTKANLETQRALAAKSLAAERILLGRLDQLVADVRENHRRTIQMRIDHYTARIADLDASIAEVQA